MATHALATFSVNLQYDQIPRSVIDAAIASFYNWAGCAIGGSNHAAVAIAHSALSPFFGPAHATILGHQGSQKTDAQHAALLNGIASHVHDYDDTHLATIIHPTGPVASALLAAAEFQPPVSGRQFLLALIAGIEAECKVGIAVYPAHYDVGWHITSTTGSIGAAVAVSKLLDLTVPQTQHAIGIAATQVTGLREMFGSHTKSFHPGRAAQNGLLAALTARQGYTSSLQALEAKRGWANVVSTSNTLDAQMASLATVWEVQHNSFKPFPCGIVIHPIIDACIQLHDDDGVRTEQIDGVHARVHHLVLELTGKKAPRDGLEGKFSVYHGAAVGLVLGRATPAEYEDGVVNDPVVVGVRDRVTATVDKDVRSDEAVVEVRLKGGRVVRKRVEHAVGSLEVPMTKALLTGKFVGQCVPVLGRAAAERASEACWGVEGVRDMRDLAAVL